MGKQVRGSAHPDKAASFPVGSQSHPPPPRHQTARSSFLPFCLPFPRLCCHGGKARSGISSSRQVTEEVLLSGEEVMDASLLSRFCFLSPEREREKEREEGLTPSLMIR